MRARALVLLLASAFALAGCGSVDADYGEELAHEPAVVIELEDGERLALSTPTDQHTLVAQWGDGDSWSTPQELYRDEENRITLGEPRISKANGTVAVGVDVWRATPSEPGGDGQGDELYTVLAVCHDLTCEDGKPARILSSPEMDGSGDVVTFAVDHDQLLVWRREKGFATHPVSALPDAHSTVLLADGEIVGVASSKGEAGCVYELYVADQSLVFARVAATPPYPGLCGIAGVDTKGSDRITVYAEAVEDDIAFARVDGTWQADVSAVQRMAYPEGAHSIAPTEAFLEGGTLLVGSPRRPADHGAVRRLRAHAAAAGGGPPARGRRARRRKHPGEGDLPVGAATAVAAPGDRRPAHREGVARGASAARRPGRGQAARAVPGRAVGGRAQLLGRPHGGRRLRRHRFRRGDVGIAPHVDEDGKVIE